VNEQMNGWMNGGREEARERWMDECMYVLNE